jgi:hypothetical protein
MASPGAWRKAPRKRRTEEIVYDAETSQLVTAGWATTPRCALTLPMMENHRTVTVTPSNPLGVKGIGEGHDRRCPDRRQCGRRCAATGITCGHSGRR